MFFHLTTSLPQDRASFNAKPKVSSFWGFPQHLSDYRTILLLLENVSLSWCGGALWGWQLCHFYLYVPGLACGRHITNADWIKVKMEWKRSVKINAKQKTVGVREEWGLEMAIKIYLSFIHKFVKKKLFMYVISVQLKINFKTVDSYKPANYLHSR